MTKENKELEDKETNPINFTAQCDRVIGYAKDNDGNPLTDHPLEAFGDMVIIENISKTASSASEEFGGLVFDSDIGEHQEIGGWVVVAKGEFVKRVDVGDLISQPIGNSITPVLHPLIAKRVQYEDKNGIRKTYTKEDLDYVYAVVNMNLIGARYK